VNVYLADPATALAERWQRGFPLASQPFLEIGRASGLDEDTVVEMLRGLVRDRVLSRIGPAIRPNTIGSSTLAAMSVPSNRLDEVAATVNACPAVNHNYEREHAFNLWFVVTGPDRSFVRRTLEELTACTGCQILDLTIETPYHIDLGFRLQGRKRAVTKNGPHPGQLHLGPDSVRLVRLLEPGIPLVRQPYAELASQLGLCEDEVLAGIRQLLDCGAISRFGCILRHRKLGYRANAMAVWDVPDGMVDECAAKLCAQDAVTLCYSRTRCLPDWPYNLFAMIHGKRQEDVEIELADVAGQSGLAGCNSAVLFSRRCFKQTGARYFSFEGVRT
jgi:DNA-binding Lrp family transcriptional regulator